MKKIILGETKKKRREFLTARQRSRLRAQGEPVSDGALI